MPADAAVQTDLDAALRPAALFPRMQEVTADFTVRANACPHVVNRLLNFFAQQDMIPAAIRSVRRGDEITLFVRQREIAEHRAEVIAEKMRGLVMVGSVELECQLH